jgi:hypothetical protein
MSWMIRVQVPGGTGNFVSPLPHLGWLWGPPSLLSSGYQSLFPLPKYAFMAWCSIKAQGHLYITSFFWNAFTSIKLDKTVVHCYMRLCPLCSTSVSTCTCLSALVLHKYDTCFVLCETNLPFTWHSGQLLTKGIFYFVKSKICESYHLLTPLSCASIVTM